MKNVGHSNTLFFIFKKFSFNLMCHNPMKFIILRNEDCDTSYWNQILKKSIEMSNIYFLYEQEVDTNYEGMKL
jgi:AAA15 family ATPase/GTPase